MSELFFGRSHQAPQNRFRWPAAQLDRSVILLSSPWMEPFLSSLAPNWETRYSAENWDFANKYVSQAHWPLVYEASRISVRKTWYRHRPHSRIDQCLGLSNRRTPSKTRQPDCAREQCNDQNRCFHLFFIIFVHFLIVFHKPLWLTVPTRSYKYCPLCGCPLPCFMPSASSERYSYRSRPSWGNNIGDQFFTCFK